MPAPAPWLGVMNGLSEEFAKMSVPARPCREQGQPRHGLCLLEGRALLCFPGFYTGTLRRTVQALHLPRDSGTRNLRVRLHPLMFESVCTPLLRLCKPCPGRTPSGPTLGLSKYSIKSISRIFPRLNRLLERRFGATIGVSPACLMLRTPSPA